MRLPKIPYMCITKSDGERLKSAATKGPITTTLVAEVTRAWRTVPIVVADVPGRTPDFVLVATHLDAWYHGMTDTGGSVASILDMARVLQRHTGELQRGVRFAWWTGHSFGRYAGSSWYVDRFWADLDRHCVASRSKDKCNHEVTKTRRTHERERHRLNCLFSGRNHPFHPLAIDGIVRRAFCHMPAVAARGSC